MSEQFYYLGDDYDLEAAIAKLPPELQEELRESKKMGFVMSDRWQDYTWKNELAEQKDRIAQHLDEILTEKETEHSPFHMIERAVGVAAVCMRRLIECRLVTDRFRDSHLDVHEIHRKSKDVWHEPWISDTARDVFTNYNLQERHPARRKPKQIADRFLHARVIAINANSVYIPDGLLIASDTQQRENLFHFTPIEFAAVLDAFLDDGVRSAYDGYDDTDGINKGKVIARRD